MTGNSISRSRRIGSQLLIRCLNRSTSQVASWLRPGVATAVAIRDTTATTTNHIDALSPDLTLYEYEASPWCRIVREYATILDLTLQIRPCPRQTLFQEGAYDITSRFRPEAMYYLQKYHQTNDLTFPLLIDRTKHNNNNNKKNDDEVVVIHESYAILCHLWEQYGQTVLPTKQQQQCRRRHRRRPDQYMNATQIPFILRFLSLASPSYLRVWPTCGILQTKSVYDDDNKDHITLYQSEGCWESRLVRETLCTLELPYTSVPVAKGSQNSILSDHQMRIPVLQIKTKNDATTRAPPQPQPLQLLLLEGADSCVEYLWNTYRDQEAPLPKFTNTIPQPNNIGRTDGSFGIGAYTAFVRGSRAFVPPAALQ